MNLVFTKAAHKQLMKLSARVHEAVVKKISYVVADFGVMDLNLDIKNLSDRAGFRLRVGDYRVIYEIDKLRDELVVISVGQGESPATHNTA